MTTEVAPGPQAPPQPQAVAAQLTGSAIFLVVTIRPGADNCAAVRALFGDLAGLLRAVGFRDLDGKLSCVVGIGSQAWDRLAGSARPAGLHVFQEIEAGSRHAVSTPGDILFHIRATRFDLCFELATHIMTRLGTAVSPVDEVHGFRYFDDRDLIGFVDGTENPTGQAAAEATIIGPEDAEFTGGSYVIVQKYLHDLSRWNTLPTEEQERIVGRTKLTDIELDDSVKPTSAHNALTTITENGEEIQDRPRQHALRHGQPGRFRHLLHRLRPLAASHRADAGKHVHRPSAGKLRPTAGLQPGRDGQPVLRAVSAVA